MNQKILGFILLALGIIGIGASFAFSCDSQADRIACSDMLGWPLFAIFQVGALFSSNGPIPTSVAVLAMLAVALTGVGLLLFGKKG